MICCEWLPHKNGTHVHCYTVWRRTADTKYWNRNVYQKKNEWRRRKHRHCYRIQAVAHKYVCHYTHSVVIYLFVAIRIKAVCVLAGLNINMYFRWLKWFDTCSIKLECWLASAVLRTATHCSSPLSSKCEKTHLRMTPNENTISASSSEEKIQLLLEVFCELNYGLLEVKIMETLRNSTYT